MLPVEWSNEMAYIVGLTATDGCLFTGFRKINFKSADRELVASYLDILGRTNRVKEQITRTGGMVYFTEFGDTELYRWFQSIGLTPRKSLTLGAIDVPDACFFALLRGLFEGDGTIQNFVHRPTPSTAPTYQYERLWLFFTSASRAHVEWIRSRAADLSGVSGYIERRPERPGHHEFFRVKYGKRDAIELLSRMYPRPDVPKLERKWRIWEYYRRRKLLS